MANFTLTLKCEAKIMERLPKERYCYFEMK